MCVMHIVDAMGGSDRFWGKESVVAMLMREQRASGMVEPILVTFSPTHLGAVLATEGFRVKTLADCATRGIGRRTLRALAAVLRREKPAVMHSHGYRANITARLARCIGLARGARLISTCHGWVESTRALRAYNAIDRWSSALSDVTTVPDPRMLAAFPPAGRHEHVANGVPDQQGRLENVTPISRAGAFVAGTLGRVTEEKGILDVLSAADGFPDPAVVFAVAGEGELAPRVRTAGPNVRYLGFFERPDSYLSSLDVYVQASHAEGLSLSLLEAMRAGKAIVATDVGATRDAVADRESALLVPPRDAPALRRAILMLRDDPELHARLARNARARFEAEFRIGCQHQKYLELYQTGRKP